MNFGMNFRENGKVCYMDTDSLIAQVKTDDVFKDVAEDVEIRFENSNFELDTSFPIEKIKK